MLYRAGQIVEEEARTLLLRRTPTRSERINGVSRRLEEAELDIALALAGWSAGDLSLVEHRLRKSRENLTRAIATIKRRGAAGVR